MIDIEITGCRSERKAGFIRSACEFYLRKLVPRHKSMQITIEIVRKLIDNEEAAGQLAVEDNHPHHEFTISLDSSYKLGEMLRTLAHECVHVKQYATGELRYTNCYHVQKWKNKMFNTGTGNYWELPWEIEANGREKGLFIMWVEENNYAGRYKWCQWRIT
jgi:hypothetical protein